jgi:hypothetical protein
MNGGNMSGFTKLEIKVFNKILDTCYEDYSASAKGLAKDLDMPINTIKGVIGSLVKKGKVQCEEEERSLTLFLDVFAIDDEHGFLSFGGDRFSEEEYKQFYLKKDKS